MPTMVDGSGGLENGPYTALRAVPLPSKCGGG
jgi:hypothetical protein